MCWQHVLTEHQVHTWRAFAALPHTKLTLVISREELPHLQVAGWVRPVWGDLDVVQLRASGWWQQAVAILRARRDAVNLFCGLWAERRSFPLVLRAAAGGRRVALISEPYCDKPVGYYRDLARPVAAALVTGRRLAYRLAGAALGRRVGPVFAISAKAVEQFSSAGFQRGALAPFGYFIRPSGGFPTGARGEGLRLAFVGALSRRKGVDLAVAAIARCRAAGLPVTLDIYGSGTLSASLPEGLALRGVVPFGSVPGVLARYDALLMPSRFDGWGVVVNEALQAGVPVLASCHAGAAVLVESSGAGAVFDPTDEEALPRCVAGLCRDRGRLDRWRAAALGFRPRLAPSVAAEYVRDVLLAWARNEPLPTDPWYVRDVASTAGTEED